MSEKVQNGLKKLQIAKEIKDFGEDIIGKADLIEQLSILGGTNSITISYTLSQDEVPNYDIWFNFVPTGENKQDKEKLIATIDDMIKRREAEK